MSTEPGRSSLVKRVAVIALTCVCVLLATERQNMANEERSLMKMLAEWQYPKSTFNGATMSDGETVNAAGKRTVPSIKCNAVLTTADSMEKVVEFYKAKFKINPDAKPADDKAPDESGRSVSIQEDSTNRPVAICIIMVNADKTSTTLVISRGEKEAETHIAWTHYIRF